ncbi:MAG: hypothetical protein WAU36_06655 [Cyclobacteriaceae bacterium]
MRETIHYISSKHCYHFEIDDIWQGLDVYHITDLNLLIEWWNSVKKYVHLKELAAEDKKYRIESWIEFFYASLWIRINQLHPKLLLRFDDIKI